MERTDNLQINDGTAKALPQTSAIAADPEAAHVRRSPDLGVELTNHQRQVIDREEQRRLEAVRRQLANQD